MQLRQREWVTAYLQTQRLQLRMSAQLWVYNELQLWIGMYITEMERRIFTS